MRKFQILFTLSFLSVLDVTALLKLITNNANKLSTFLYFDFVDTNDLYLKPLWKYFHHFRYKEIICPVTVHLIL